jgi:thioredoxin reductase
MREQVSVYPTVDFINEAAVDASVAKASFDIALSGGSAIHGAKLLLAFGVSDILPEISGLAERWGKSVLHCPYCHGYEVSDRRLGVMYVTPASLQQTQLVADWGPTTFYSNGAEIDDAALEPLRLRNIEIERSPIEELHGPGGDLSAIKLLGGRIQSLDALFVSPRYRLNSEVAEKIGCTIEAGPLGRVVATDEFKSTNVDGVFAAGDISRMAHNVTFAYADGVMAAMAIHRSLVWSS